MARMPIRPLLLLLALFITTLGCGSTKSRMATEQLLVSDAVDQAVTIIDFRSLAGENVYLDTRFLVNVKGVGFVNSEYIISSLRQQMVAADLRLKDKAEDADFIVEARVGALGSDGNEIIYGIPANKGLSEASAMVPNAPALPSIPEISVARKESQLGAVKVAAFAYDRRTGSPVWQSGIARTRTTSQDVWLFGAGPFQRGSIHSGTEFAGGEIRFPGQKKPTEIAHQPPVNLDEEFYFPRSEASHVVQTGSIDTTQPPAQAPRPAGQPRSNPAPLASPPNPPAADIRPLPLVGNGGASPIGTENPSILPSNPNPLIPAFR